jgi:hypothetical protein
MNQQSNRAATRVGCVAADWMSLFFTCLSERAEKVAEGGNLGANTGKNVSATKAKALLVESQP